MPLDHYVTLGRSGLRVSPFALGAMTFGEERRRRRLQRRRVREDPRHLPRPRRELRGQAELFSTNGHSEKILGDFFAAQPGRREHVVPASKFSGNMFPGDVNGGGAGRASIIAQLDETLRRLVPWSPLKNGFLSGKYRRGADVADSARVAFVGGPSDAVSPAWLRARRGTAVPIVGARRLEHLTGNLAGLDVTLTAAQLARLDEVSAPEPGYPAPMHGAQRAMLQFAGTTVDGEPSTVYPPLPARDVRY